MMRGTALFLFALGLPAAVMAAAPPATPAAVGAKPAAPIAPTQSNRRITMSAEGNAIARQIIGTPDPRMTEIRAEMGKIREQKLQIISAPGADIDKLQQLFRREEVLQTEFVKRQNDRLLSLLRALPTADKVVLLQTLANPAKLPAAAVPVAPAVPAKPAPAKPVPAKPAKSN